MICVSDPGLNSSVIVWTAVCVMPVSHGRGIAWVQKQRYPQEGVNYRATAGALWVVTRYRTVLLRWQKSRYACKIPSSPNAGMVTKWSSTMLSGTKMYFLSKI